MGRHSTLEQVTIRGQRAWVKRYSHRDRRRMRLAALRWLALMLDVQPLVPPPRHRGDEACRTERRRLAELQSSGIPAPIVLDHGEHYLVLSDRGTSLAQRMRELPPTQRAELLLSGARAIRAAHDKGAYLGHPAPRNMAIDACGLISFLDFEEDPAEVMSLPCAQARDWMIYCASALAKVPGDEQQMAQAIAPLLPPSGSATHVQLCRATARLGFLRRLTAHAGERTRALGRAVALLDRGLTLGCLMLGAALFVDHRLDGELDLLAMVFGLLRDGLV